MSADMAVTELVALTAQGEQRGNGFGLRHAAPRTAARCACPPAVLRWQRRLKDG